MTRAPSSRLLARDLKLAARIGGSGALGLVFFLMIVTLVPFALGPDLNLLARIGPAILWLAAVLATLIGLDRLFQADEEDGSLDLLRARARAARGSSCSPRSLAHWLTTGLPLALAAPLFGLLVALTPARHGRDGRDAPRRHAGAHLHRRGRGGAHRLAPPRRPDPRRSWSCR